MADTLTGTFRPLPELWRAALDWHLRRAGRDQSGLDAAMERARALPPYPDARAAIDRLRGAALEVGVLTNSATDAAEAALRHAGLIDGLSLVVGSDAVGAYKPDPRVYRHGVERTGASAEEVCLVAAHWWDVLGARRAGLRTAWVARRERELLGDVAPELRGTTLDEAARQIVAQLLD
jgi:2-haloacid dehalogenase